MFLTDRERDFLAVFIHEATTDPFKGPATEELHRHDLYYEDLPYLLAAYYRENPEQQQGFGGTQTPSVPPFPWRDREAALQRNSEVQTALEKIADHTAS